jgi:hypothetical protein
MRSLLDTLYVCNTIFVFGQVDGIIRFFLELIKNKNYQNLIYICFYSDTNKQRETSIRIYV